MRRLISIVIILMCSMISIQSVSAQAGESIIIVSRELGSGTRGAFVELAGIVDQYGDDNITVEADVLNTTGGVMQTVAGNRAAIGYISYGSINDAVKPLKIEGVAVSPEAVRSGDYPLARPFNLAWRKEGLSQLGQDFLTFIYSNEGQAIVEKSGYISMGADVKWQGQSAGQYAYQSQGLTGELSIVGSTSLTPVIEKLAEAYKKQNGGVKINITSNGSTAGLTAALGGTADIGMASRALTTTELAQMEAAAFALDGIVVVVNPIQTLDNMSLETLRQIYNGSVTKW